MIVEINLFSYCNMNYQIQIEAKKQINRQQSSLLRESTRMRNKLIGKGVHLNGKEWTQFKVRTDG